MKWPAPTQGSRQNGPSPYGRLSLACPCRPCPSPASAALFFLRPDHDWTARFFNDIQDVSSEEMQSLWAKVLAGEVEKPGSTSIQTLSILKNLDQATARLFGKLCSICISLRLDGNQFIDARVPSLGGDAGSNALQEYGLDFGNLNVLNEHGLVISDYNSWVDYRVCAGVFSSGRNPGKVGIPFGFQGRNWVFLTTKRAIGQELRIHGVALTRSGRVSRAE